VVVIKRSTSEKLACLRKGRDHDLAEAALGGSESKEGRQAVWNPKKGERDPLHRFCSSIAS
jgi:hypothetical protein